MKKILFYASVACIIATFSSCSDNNSATPFVGIPGTIIGLDENECPEEVVYLTISPMADVDAYQWYKDGVAIDGATASTYVVTVSGTYSVAGVNAAGTGTPSPDHVVTIVPCSGEKPEIPTIQGATENVCPDVTVVLTAEAEGATSYQWYKDGEPIDGATTDTYEVTESGAYTVIGVNDDGEGEPSADHVVTITTCEEPENIFEDVESHTDFAVDSPGTIGWTYINTGKTTYGPAGWDFPTENQPGYVVLNPSQTAEPVDGSFPPYSGSKFFACFNSSDASMTDAWIVSPELSFSSPFTFSFYARSLTLQYGAERFKVGYSTTGNNQADFTEFVTTNPYQAASEEFEEYSYTIPAEAKYVAIQCVSVDAFSLFIDDIFIGIGRAPHSSAPKVAQNVIVDDLAKHVVRKKQ